MNKNIPNYSTRHNSALWRWIVSMITVFVTTVGSFAPIAVSAVAQAKPLEALSNTLHLSVVSAADSITPVGDYKYIINFDNTGTTEQRSPTPGSGCSTADAGYPE